MQYSDYLTSATYIKTFIDFTPEIAIILGSGLSEVANIITNPIIIDYKDIPNFLKTTVSDHMGKMILGECEGKKIVCMSGRCHYYEGYDFTELSIAVRVLRLLGAEKLIVTNASGAVNPNYNVGDIVIINDHINLTSVAPTRGTNLPQFGKRFFDMTHAYDSELSALAFKVAQTANITAHRGVYQFFSGPQFETPAEIKVARLLGADLVGMSTVPEVIAAVHCGFKILGISLVTNMAAGVSDALVDSDDVTQTSARSAVYVSNLIQKIIKEIK